MELMVERMRLTIVLAGVCSNTPRMCLLQRFGSDRLVIVTVTQTHANVLELTGLLVRVVEEGVLDPMSEYDDEIVDEEQDWSDFDDIGEYDDLDLE